MSDPARPVCSHCGVGHHFDDVFCESCGYDFITGSLPDDAGEGAMVPPGAVMVPPGAVMVPPGAVMVPPGAVMVPPGAVTVPEVETMVEVAVDVDYFEVVVRGGELELPQPIPSPISVAVSGREVHIGRTSASRNIHPDVDVGELTGDPAVSSRHAVVRVNADGSLSITDVGSTNGTTISSPSASLLVADTPTTLDVGQPVFLGAWTRLTVTRVGAAAG